ncbi:DUF4190 domain-containing protein [Sutcliffiella sp. NPDC057660]|uniref:DUF4190 domain-containing protein n=1 Tax=Sutcliffiella sp. NPDC057660 TaxID=3346199 RepID=UPI00368FA2BC
MTAKLSVKESPKVNNKAILTLVLGMFSIFISIIMALGFIPGIIGITVGFLGLREMKMSNQNGKSLATIGILICVIGTFLPVLFMI